MNYAAKSYVESRIFDMSKVAETPTTVDVPHVSRVQLGQLNIDPGYQRELRKANLRNLRKWDWIKFNPLKVSRRVGGPRAGELFVWDGQHRYHVATELFGEKQAVTCIITPMTYEQEAEYFARQDEASVNVTTSAKFHALVEARDPVALDISRIVEEADFFITTNKNKSGPGRGLVAHGTLLRIYNQHGPERLQLILHIINAAWPPGVRDRNSHQVLSGLSLFLTSYPEADVARLITKLSEPDATPHRLAQHASVYSGMTGGKQVALSRAMLDAYNKHLRINHLEWAPARARSNAQRKKAG